MINWTDEQLEFIDALRRQKEQWRSIAKQVNKKFDLNASADAVNHAHQRWSDIGFFDNDQTTVRKARQARVAQRTSAFNARTLRHVLDNKEFEKTVLEGLEEIVEKVNSFKPPKPPKKYPNKFSMVMELMLSDLHFGKLIKNGDKVVFNEKVARSRMKEITSVVLKELAMAQKHYNVEKIIVALLGDMIESYEIHDLESARGCEYGTAKQIWACIDSLLFDVLIPLAETGLPIEVPAVTGNHDRSERRRTYNNPGENNWTFVIYKTLEGMLEGRGYKNVKFRIPEGAYTHLSVFGNTVLYEHFDNAGSMKRESIDKLMRKRGRQIGKMVDMIRGGHYHDYTMYGNGEIIVNGSLPGNDSYADTLGFRSDPCQALNYYLDFPRNGTKKKNSFHKTFGIKLD
jgi:hypothetical protein